MTAGVAAAVGAGVKAGVAVGVTRGVAAGVRAGLGVAPRPMHCAAGFVAGRMAAHRRRHCVDSHCVQQKLAFALALIASTTLLTALQMSAQVKSCTMLLHRRLCHSQYLRKA